MASTLAPSLRLFARYASWRLGSRHSGERLIDALDSPDDHLRTLAASLLSRAGRRAGPLLVDAVRRRRSLCVTLLLLGDLELAELEPLLASFTGDADPEVARAARDALGASSTPAAR